MVGDEVREEFLYLCSRDDRGVNSDALLVGDVAAQLVLMLAPSDLQETRVDKPALPTDAFLPVAEIILVTDKRQLGFSREVVMHTHESARVTSGTRSTDLTLEDGGFKSALGQVEGETCAHHARADDNGIVGLGHR